MIEIIAVSGWIAGEGLFEVWKDTFGECRQCYRFLITMWLASRIKEFSYIFMILSLNRQYIGDILHPVNFLIKRKLFTVTLAKKDRKKTLKLHQVVFIFLIFKSVDSFG